MTPRDRGRIRAPFAAAAAVLLLASIGGCEGAVRPAALQAGTSCASCRMIVSDVHFAAQLVAPGEEPLFFDDIGCLAAHAARGGMGRVAFVADHRTGEWVRADEARYSFVPALDTPMGSRLIAHANEASRSDDPAARGSEPRDPVTIFGPGGPPAGAR